MWCVGVVCRTCELNRDPKCLPWPSEAGSMYILWVGMWLVHLQAELLHVICKEDVGTFFPLGTLDNVISGKLFLRFLIHNIV